MKNILYVTKVNMLIKKNRPFQKNTYFIIKWGLFYRFYIINVRRQGDKGYQINVAESKYSTCIWIVVENYKVATQLKQKCLKIVHKYRT